MIIIIMKVIVKMWMKMKVEMKIKMKVNMKVNMKVKMKRMNIKWNKAIDQTKPLEEQLKLLKERGDF